MSYWDRLKEKKLYSIQIRLERYMIIYMRKIIEGKVPNCGMSWTFSERKGRLCSTPPLSKVSGKCNPYMKIHLRLWDQSCSTLLSQELRNLLGFSKDAFKSKLDKFLEFIPD